MLLNTVSYLILPKFECQVTELIVTSVFYSNKGKKNEKIES